MESKIEKAISYQATFWYNKLPSDKKSLYSLSDFKQMGWECYLKLERDSAFDKRKSSKAYFLSVCLSRDYVRLIRKENYRSSLCEDCSDINFDNDILDEFSFSDCDLLLDFVRAISNLSEDFLDMVKNGVPSELRDKAKKDIREKRIERGWSPDGGKFRISKKVFEDFFGISLSLIRDTYYRIYREP